MKNYGMPYKGSKNKIAEKIISVLSEADCFVDLFGGGGAMSHCAVLSGKYRKVIYNEINPVVYKGFKMALNGEFKDEKRWISREEFHRLKDKDPYVAICFSFGNDLKTYAYSPENERLKEHLHNIFFAEIPENSYISWKNFLNYYKTINHDYINEYKILQNLDSLKRLQNFEYFDRIKKIPHLDIECHNLSYEQVEIPENSVVYCDIPYKNAKKYPVDFDHEKFYSWAESQPSPVYISEYSMPEEFTEIKSFEKRCTLCIDNSKTTVEKIFINRTPEGM